MTATSGTVGWFLRSGNLGGIRAVDGAVRLGGATGQGYSSTTAYPVTWAILPVHTLVGTAIGPGRPRPGRRSPRAISAEWSAQWPSAVRTTALGLPAACGRAGGGQGVQEALRLL